MAFRRGAAAQSRPPTTRTVTEENLPNTSPSNSPTRPLLVPAGDEETATTMMEDGQTHNASLVEHDMSSSPYLNASTFEPNEEELKKLKHSQQRWNLVIFSIGSAAFFFALVSMAMIGTPFVVFCFVFPLVLGPYIIRQRRFMNKFPTLRRLINRLRFQANRLQAQNNKFANENTRLEGEIESLKRIEFQLHQLCQKSGSSIQEMQKLIKENGSIQKEMKKLQDAAELQDLLQAILVSDSNMDFVLSDEELSRLTLRLKCFSVVDEERLKQALRMSSTSSSQFKAHQEERDVEIVPQGALTGVNGWMV